MTNREPWRVSTKNGLDSELESFVHICNSQYRTDALNNVGSHGFT